MTIAALYALAVTWLGFAHQPISMATGPSSPERFAYALPDGTVPDLCIPQSDEPTRGGAFAVCEACVVAAGHGTPVAVPLLPLPTNRAIARIDAAPNGVARATERHRARARSPPLAKLIA